MSEDCKGTPGTLAPEDQGGLSNLGRLEAFAHGNRQAYVVRPGDCHYVVRPGDCHYVVRPSDCHYVVRPGDFHYVVRPGDFHACQRCIEACPEDAIRLVPLRA